MADPSVRKILLHFLLQEQRQRLINRLIAFVLFFAGMYLILFLGLVILDLPLLLFHFLLFFSLSLLPLFLILGPESERTVAVLRRIDQHCQTETYLTTTSPAHRSFLEQRVKNLLERPEARKMLLFRLAKINRFLAMGVLGLFVLVQLASLVTFQRLTPNLNALAMKNLRTQSETSARRGPRDAEGIQKAPRGEAPEAGSPAEAASKQFFPPRGRSGETRARDADAPQGEADQSLPGAQTVVPPSRAAEGEEGSESVPWVPMPIPEGGIGSALKGALEEGPEPEVRQGELPAGTGEAGKALTDSPLREYSASSLKDRIQTEGGTKLTAGTSKGPDEEQPFDQALFADIPFRAAGEIGFDPAIERIRRRYLELLNERY